MEVTQLARDGERAGNEQCPGPNQQPLPNERELSVELRSGFAFDVNDLFIF